MNVFVLFIWKVRVTYRGIKRSVTRERGQCAKREMGDDVKAGTKEEHG